MNEIWLHGEVIVKKVKGSIPEGAKLVKPMAGLTYKVADSETTGNHHLLELPERIAGLEVWEKDGMFYVRNPVPVMVRCVDVRRHDTIEIPACAPDEVLVFDKQQEVDHLTDEVRSVRD
ncbi:MAG: hypothetical protein E6Q97_16345 [Desulfurellales bacterium]|nr:MAG: hypothetical protein E6Q97_16345 [Desulfurellales bacterium]